LQPDNEIAYYNLRFGSSPPKEYNSAITTANRAAALEPSNPHPLVAFCAYHWDDGDRLLYKAYHQAINLDPRYRDRTFLTHLSSKRV